MVSGVCYPPICRRPFFEGSSALAGKSCFFNRRYFASNPDCFAGIDWRPDLKKRTGALIVGARGHIATVLICGALAARKGLCSRTGMVTELPDFKGLELIELEDLVFGGWDIRNGSLIQNAQALCKETRILDWDVFLSLREELESIEQNIFTGTPLNCGRAIEALAEQGEAIPSDSLPEIVEKLAGHIEAFKSKNGLQHTIVINLGSTEPPLSLEKYHLEKNTLTKIIANDCRDLVRASTLYAYAAILTGSPFINFTPSNAALLPGMIELADDRGVPVMGNDGKTGETLVKSALAPMFKYRNLEVLSWEGYNILGNMDGKVLANGENKVSKLESKSHVLSQILGYEPHSKVSIDYVPSLDDWKTAWDFIHFEGFLGTRMTCQFIWQGCDSVLAAPLVLDLVRLANFAMRKKEKGLMKQLACFFKSPIGVDEGELVEQYRHLQNYLRGHRNDPECNDPS